MWCIHMRPARECHECNPPPPEWEPIINGSPASPERKTVDKLPTWCRGVRFDSSTRTVTLQVAIPTRDAFGRMLEQPIAFEVDEPGIRALVDAFTTMAAKFSAPPRVIDVDAD